MGKQGKKSPQTTNAQPPAPPDGEAEEEQVRMLTQADLEAALQKCLNENFNPTVKKLQDTLEEVTRIATNALKMVEQQKEELHKLKEDFNKMKTLPTRISAIEERVEERTNRQLRKTLVFKGIQPAPSDSDNEDTNHAATTPRASTSTREPWKVTENLVRKQIAKICKLEFEQTNMIERCHRGARSASYKGTGPQPIYAAIYDWKDCELIIEKFRLHNMSNPTSPIRVEYKYGPLTTKRRNLAMAERKRLKDNGDIISAYVAYPAKLMVKSTRSEKYKLQQDFSQAKVEFGKRDH